MISRAASACGASSRSTGRSVTCRVALLFSGSGVSAHLHPLHYFFDTGFIKKDTTVRPWAAFVTSAKETYSASRPVINPTKPPH